MKTNLERYGLYGSALYSIGSGIKEGLRNVIKNPAVVASTARVATGALISYLAGASPVTITLAAAIATGKEFHKIPCEAATGLKQIITREKVERTRFFIRGPGFWNDEESEKRTDYFRKLMPPERQREDWYQVTHFVAEPLNTLSNVRFITTGIKYGNPFVVLAGIASMHSHTNPHQWGLDGDVSCAALAGLSLIPYYNTIISDYSLIAATVGVGTLFALDMHLAATIATWWIHPAWHLAGGEAIEAVLSQAHSTLQSS